MANNNSVKETVIRKGYKHSTLGWIPDEWGIYSLQELGIFSKGKGITKEQLSEKGIPCIRYGEIYTSHDIIIKDFKSFISSEVAKESIRIQKGNILFAGSGETSEDIGKAVAFMGDEEAYAGGDVIIFDTNSERVNPEYLSYTLESSPSRKQKFKLGQGNQVVHIYPSTLGALKILLPTLPEQKAIAALLSTWDKAITNCQLLIDNCQLRKKWLMQQLLTGKKRLPGFTEEWENKRISSIADEVSIKNKDNRDLTVLSCTKYDGLVPSLEYFGRKIFADDLTTYKVVPKHHFAYATNHIEEGSIGYQDQFEAGLISPMYTVFKTNGQVNDSYLFRLLKTNNYIMEYQKRMEGSINRRGGLRWNEFSKIKLPVPSLEEQAAIASILRNADQEINLQKQKLKALKEQKKGLMKQILTGQKRVKY